MHLAIIEKSIYNLFEFCYTNYSKGDKKMSTKNTAILCYLMLPIALARLFYHTEAEKQAVKFHLNQALVITVAALLTAIPCIGWIWGIFVIVCWVLGLVAAVNQEEKPVPFLGKYKIIK